MPNNNELIDAVLNHIKSVDLSKNIMYKDNYIYKRSDTKEVDDPDYLPIGDDYHTPNKITVNSKIYDFIRTYKVNNENNSFELQVNQGESIFREGEEPEQLKQPFKTADFYLLKKDMMKNIGLLWMICSVCNIDALKLFKDTELTNMEKKRLELKQKIAKIDEKVKSLTLDKAQLQNALSEINSMIEKYNFQESKSEVKNK